MSVYLADQPNKVDAIVAKLSQTAQVELAPRLELGIGRVRQLEPQVAAGMAGGLDDRTAELWAAYGWTFGAFMMEGYRRGNWRRCRALGQGYWEEGKQALGATSRELAPQCVRLDPSGSGASVRRGMGARVEASLRCSGGT